MKITDPTTAPAPVYARWAAPLLNDARDVTMVALMMECTLVCILGSALWLSNVPMVYVGPFYALGLLAWILDRFTLMLHCTSHRQLFNKRYRALNYVIPWLLGPWFGQTPNTYFAHHMGMHHREENLGADLSSTMRFRRDRFSNWLRYYGRFLFFGIFELSAYFWKRGQKKMFWKVLAGEGTYFAILATLFYFKPGATLVVFVAPFLLIRTLMMMGNWAQHSFVCRERPEDPYRASITCVNTRYNRRCFNDGYHVLHHVKPRCHWTEHPIEFQKSLTEYAQRDSIVFDGIDFFQVWLLLMTGSWRTLARHFVQLPGAPVRNEQEIISFLQDRVLPIPTSVPVSSPELPELERRAA